MSLGGESLGESPWESLGEFLNGYLGESLDSLLPLFRRHLLVVLIFSVWVYMGHRSSARSILSAALPQCPS